MEKQNITRSACAGSDINLSEIIRFRVTPRMKAALIRQAHRQGLPTLSALLQDLVVRELDSAIKKNEAA